MYGSAKPGNKPYLATRAFAAGCREVDLVDALAGHVLLSYGAKGQRPTLKACGENSENFLHLVNDRHSRPVLLQNEAHADDAHGRPVQRGGNDAKEVRATVGGQ
ncbi:hypothetical protein DPMN_159892 [Dreissena polymorpha]|uniref:Uncharacterized protein n=1 Tax=Dreissena polymorpha TaxID=45954 RepID=A0A9D4ELT5_DREPO|nr:hypothetical protein DPMN_159892 [Dreissena polymorpha]